jgi:N-acetylmuramoyl-L-alanine amidase
VRCNATQNVLLSISRMHTVALATTVLAGIILVGPDPMPHPWSDPGYNHLLWIQSPHCDERPDNTVVDTVVVHSTVNATLQNTTEWFQNPASQVSSHFTIGKDGSIVENVSTFNRAWHAGASKDIAGRAHVNDFSIGIELVNLNDGKDPYPAAQLQVLHNLIAHLRERFPLKYVTSHEYIAVPHGRKSDPKGFPWSTLADLGLQLVP